MAHQIFSHVGYEMYKHFILIEAIMHFNTIMFKVSNVKNVHLLALHLTVTKVFSGIFHLNFFGVNSFGVLPMRIKNKVWQVAHLSSVLN